MAEQSLTAATRQIMAQDKNTAIAFFEQRCKFAESRALEAEMRLTKVMIQIYRDSPKLSSSLLLANITPSTSKTKKAGSLDEPKLQTFLDTVQTSEGSREPGVPVDKLPTSLTEKQSQLSVQKLRKADDNPAKLSEGGVSHATTEKLSNKENIQITDTTVSESRSGISAQKYGGCQPMLEKLTVELWKTKKKLFTVLQERDMAKSNIPMLDIKEYEEIINQLQEDLLLLKCQYTEIRQALQSGQPSHIVHIIGRLQDKVRRQETILRQQQSQVQALQSRTVGQGVAGTKGGVHTQGAMDQAGMDNPSAKPSPSGSQSQLTAQLATAHTQVEWLKEELSKSRNTINSLRTKCQILGEQHEQTVATLEKLEQLKESHGQILYQRAQAELIWARQQLRLVVGATERLTKENEQLKQISEAQRKEISDMKKEHERKKAEFAESIALGERNFQFLQERYSTTLAELQELRARDLVKAELERRGQELTCAQQVSQPSGLHPGFVEEGLLVDCEVPETSISREPYTRTGEGNSEESILEARLGVQQLEPSGDEGSQSLKGAIVPKSRQPAGRPREPPTKADTVGKEQQRKNQHGSDKQQQPNPSGHHAAKHGPSS